MFGKRIFLFIAVNLLIVATISIVTSLLGIRPYLSSYGLNYGALIVFTLLWGMGGSFISLALSKKMAKWMMGVKVIDQQSANSSSQKLILKVHQLARQAGLKTMPEVGVYDSSEVNAFATGPSRSNSLVAVSSGLLHKMNDREIEGVLAHEIAHIANGDMVTMTLVQGIVNAFTMFLARVVAFFVMQAMRSDDEEGSSIGGLAYYGLVIVFDIFFSILGSLVVRWFSRYREYRADEGGARISDRNKMIAALQSLKNNMEVTANQGENQPAMSSLQISSNKSHLMALFSTHPTLEDRINRLRSQV